MTFKDIVSKVIELAQEENHIDDLLKKKYGVELGLEYNSPKTDAYIEASRSRESVLDKYLNTLSTDLLGKLKTTMYFGRDSKDIHNNDILDYHQYLHYKGIDRIDALRSLNDKRPSIEKYFYDGMKKIEDLSIDIESIL